jgi:hypothetical protein
MKFRGMCPAQGFTTDPTRPVQIWALDFSYKDGTFSKRDLGQASSTAHQTDQSVCKA